MPNFGLIDVLLLLVFLVIVGAVVGMLFKVPAALAFADRMTRTQWLLVLLLGVVMWLGGGVVQQPFPVLLGLIVTVVSALSAWRTTRKA